MTSPLKYNADENLRRIQMEKSTKFVVLEGEDDIPLYERVLEQKFDEEDYVLLFGGGKVKICEFLGKYSGENLICVLDKDFDSPSDFLDHRIILLGKYSIENYLIDKDVVINVVANATRKIKADIIPLLSISPWEEHLHQSLNVLLCALHVYQKDEGCEKLREKWTNSFLFETGNQSCVDASQVSRIMDKIYPDGAPSIPDDVVALYSDVRSVVSFFPGKLLMVGFYQYISNFITGIRAGFRSICPNKNAFALLLAGYLCESGDFVRDIDPVVRFVS